MRRQPYLFEALTVALTMILTFVVCWLALSVPPPCEYGCERTVGPGDCSERTQSATSYHNNSNCLGVGRCHPASGQSISESHDILDACRTSTGQYHIQHITTVKWDTDNDNRPDTVCDALHSCP